VNGNVTLYGHWTCPFVHRVAWALAERGIDHATIEVPPSAVRPTDFVLPDEFVAHSPRLEIPMVRVGDDYLADSIPVLEWLETAVADAPALIPRDDRDRADLVRSRMRWIDAEVFPPMIGIYYGVDDDRVERASARLSSALEALAAWLEEDPWLAGPEPSLADAVFVPFLVREEALRALGFVDPVPAAIAEYGARVRTGRGWPAVAWSRDRTDELVGRFRARRRKVAATRGAVSS
jgi:glutathione S-transferase